MQNHHWRVGARLVGLLPLTCLGAQTALAQDWYTGALGSGRGATTNSGAAAFDFSVSGTSLGDRSVVAIGTIAPFSPLDESGMRFRIGGEYSAYSYNSSTAGIGRVDGRAQSGNAMAGYEWVSPTSRIAIYGGAQYAHNSFSIIDPANKTPANATGGRVAVDFYSNPTATTMVSANAVYSTLQDAYYARARFGMAVSPGLYMGPEAQFVGSTLFNQARVGMHLSGVGMGPMQFGLSGGLVSDHSKGKGAYGQADARVRF